MSLLSVDRLQKSFGGVVAARDVSFSVAAGEMIALIGPNGAGKSTIFNMIGGQLRPDAGRAVLDGEDMSRLSPRDILRRGVGRTFQIAQAFASMRAIENVQMAIVARERQHFRLWRPLAQHHGEEARALLEQVGMAGEASRLVAHLAYADVKRVEFALALAARPRLLLMDEPTAGMAASERRALMKLVAGVARRRTIGVLFTEHDMESVFANADRVIVLARGEIIAQGEPAAVRADPRVRETYLGRAA